MAARGDRSRRNKPSKAGPSASTTPEIEAEVLQQLAELGLVVPVRDPNRPHTNTEGRCWKVGMAGLPAKGGGSFHGRFPCRSRGCDGCASLWANQEMAQFRQAQPDFVGLSPITTENLSYRPSTDKIDARALWVTSVLTPPESLKLLKGPDRHAARRRLVVQGHPVEYVVVPCDGVAVVVASADLTEEKARGRPLTAPTSGWWLPTAVAHFFLHRVLSSTAVCGRIFWTKGWRPKEEQPLKRAHVIAAPPRITETAHRILRSEGYVFTPSGPSWSSEDPMDVLLDAKRRAETVLEDPRCSVCDVVIGPDDDHWWRDGAGPMRGV